MRIDTDRFFLIGDSYAEAYVINDKLYFNIVDICDLLGWSDNFFFKSKYNNFAHKKFTQEQLLYAKNPIYADKGLFLPYKFVPECWYLRHANSPVDKNFDSFDDFKAALDNFVKINDLPGDVE